VDVTSEATEWPDTPLRGYGQMMSVRDVAQVLNLEETQVRYLLNAPAPEGGLPGVKIGKNWRIDRTQLRENLIAHHNLSLSTTAPREAQHV
jgi:excisionase family DNA binding protein